MEYFNVQRLTEVQERLKIVLEELGLTARLTKPLGDERIVFSNEDETVVHSVEILFAGTSQSDPTTWKGAYMRYTKTEEVPIGDNGWKYLAYRSNADSKPFDENIDETFTYIEECLRFYPIIREGNNHPGLIYDEDLAEAYSHIERVVRDITESPIICDRIDGANSISFTEESSGDLWRIAFKDYKAVLLINGEKLVETSSYDRNNVVRMLEDKIQEFHIPRLGFGL